MADGQQDDFAEAADAVMDVLDGRDVDQTLQILSRVVCAVILETFEADMRRTVLGQFMVDLPIVMDAVADAYEGHEQAVADAFADDEDGEPGEGTALQ